MCMTLPGRKVSLRYVRNDMSNKISHVKYTAHDADRLIFGSSTGDGNIEDFKLNGGKHSLF